MGPSCNRAVCSEIPQNPCHFLMFVISATPMRKCSLTSPLRRVAQALPKAVGFFASWEVRRGQHRSPLLWAPGPSWQGSRGEGLRAEQARPEPYGRGGWACGQGEPESHGVWRLGHWAMLLSLSEHTPQPHPHPRWVSCPSSLVLSYIPDDKALTPCSARKGKQD